MKETIAQMLKVEAEAKRIVTDAEGQADEVVRKARAEAVSIQDAAHRRAQTLLAKTVEDGVAQAKTRREDALAEIDRQNQRLLNVPQEKAEAARQLILAALAGR